MYACSNTHGILGTAGLSGLSGRFGAKEVGRPKELVVLGGRGFFGGMAGSAGFGMSPVFTSSPVTRTRAQKGQASIQKTELTLQLRLSTNL